MDSTYNNLQYVQLSESVAHILNNSGIISFDVIKTLIIKEYYTITYWYFKI